MLIAGAPGCRNICLRGSVDHHWIGAVRFECLDGVLRSVWGAFFFATVATVLVVMYLILRDGFECTFVKRQFFHIRRLS